jgi:2-dehydro-3-deoxyphosphogluconate aldolase/(4S)-4-hydroxy-2-oxoglutarate aldolase
MTLSIDEVMLAAPVIPVLTIRNRDHAVPLARALVSGGLTVLEITLRTAAGLDAVRDIRAALPNAIVGVGTLSKAAEFPLALKAGAQFGVSPGLTEEIVVAARDCGFPMLPGVMTPSELIYARQQGFEAVKLFPATIAGGVSMLKALGAVFPEVRFCPTGGITRTTAPEYLALENVRCVGGSWVAPDDKVDSGDWVTIEALARDASALQRKAR